jgi:hypothetical protein
MNDRPSYASPAAIAQARDLDLGFGHAVWRSAFLAITDSLLGESAAVRATARRLGPVRDGRERWLLNFPRLAVEVIYDPNTALIVSIVPPKADSVLSPPAPDGPSRTAQARIMA